MKTFHQEIDVVAGQSIQVNVDKPVQFSLLTNGEYEKYIRIETYWAKLSIVVQPPSAPVTADGDGHLHVLIEPVNKQDEFTATVVII